MDKQLKQEPYELHQTINLSAQIIATETKETIIIKATIVTAEKKACRKMDVAKRGYKKLWLTEESREPSNEKKIACTKDINVQHPGILNSSYNSKIIMNICHDVVRLKKVGGDEKFTSEDIVIH
ncbi:hypothetical protein HHI36_013330 [Cryptolaemus montrouzieri]|uniref:Uncharacterized protein n=1 Tax=Cryptolaemus montrouzieri TaxID=559131 RepID=A0ABD2NH53_9CUCU